MRFWSPAGVPPAVCAVPPGIIFAGPLGRGPGGARGRSSPAPGFRVSSAIVEMCGGGVMSDEKVVRLQRSIRIHPGLDMVGVVWKD